MARDESKFLAEAPALSGENKRNRKIFPIALSVAGKYRKAGKCVRIAGRRNVSTSHDVAIKIWAAWE
jgi:hypothetical protein